MVFAQGAPGHDVGGLFLDTDGVIAKAAPQGGLAGFIEVNGVVSIHGVKETATGGA
jgi:hypothetical protein